MDPFTAALMGGVAGGTEGLFNLGAVFGSGTRGSSFGVGGRRFPADILARMMPYSFPFFGSFYQPAPLWQSAYGGGPAWGGPWMPQGGMWGGDGGGMPGGGMSGGTSWMPNLWGMGPPVGDGEEPTFSYSEIYDVYESGRKDKSGDVGRIYNDAGLDPTGRYTIEELSDAMITAHEVNPLSGTSRGVWGEVLAYLGDLSYLGGLWGGGTAGGGQAALPPDVRAAYGQGTAAGLTWNPVSQQWIETTGAPELVWYEPTNETFYRGMKITADQADALLNQGSPYGDWNPMFLPPEIRATYERGTATGLSWNPATNRWIESAGAPELVWYEPTNSTYYQGQQLSPQETEALLRGGPGAIAQYPFIPSPMSASDQAMQDLLGRGMQRPDFSFLSPDLLPVWGGGPQTMMGGGTAMPPDVRAAYEQGTATGLSWNPATRQWVETTGSPELVWWEPTNETFYQGRSLSPQQAEALMAYGPQAMGYPYANQAAAPPPIQPPYVTAPQIPFLPAGNYISPMQVPGLSPDYVEPVPGAVPGEGQFPTVYPSAYSPASIAPLGGVTPTAYRPTPIIPIGVTPAPLYTPQIPIAQAQLPFGMTPAQYMEARKTQQLEPVLFEMERQYEIETDAARSRMAAAGLEGTGVEEGILARAREDFISRLTSETRTANSAALTSYYEMANELELTNAQLAQGAMQRTAELDANIQQINSQVDLDLYRLEARHQELTAQWGTDAARYAAQSDATSQEINERLEAARRDRNALQEQQASEFNAQKFFDAQVINAQIAGAFYDKEYDRQKFNSLLSKDMQLQQGNWDIQAQQLMNEFGLRWGLADIDTLRQNAELQWNATSLSAGFNEQAQELMYRTLAGLNISNTQELNDLIAITGNQNLAAYQSYLGAFSNAQGLNLNALLGIAAHERDLMRMIYGDNWNQNEYALNAYQIGVQQYGQLLGAIVNFSPFNYQRSYTESGGLI